MYIYNRTKIKIGSPEVVKRQVFQCTSGVAFFKEIFQVVNSTDLRDVKYTFKLDGVILEFSST